MNVKRSTNETGQNRLTTISPIKLKLKNSNQREVAILLNLASYAHVLSSLERILGHFLWDPGR